MRWFDGANATHVAIDDPQLAAIDLGRFVLALQSIDTDGGPPPYATTYLPLFVYREGFEYLRYGYAAAATLVMFGITAAIVGVQWLLLRRWRVVRDLASPPCRRSPTRICRSSWTSSSTEGCSTSA